MAQDQSRSGPAPTVRRPISDESWIEVSSRPSSSSLSSAATDEVVTTGLRLSQDTPDQRRRRRLMRSPISLSEGRTPPRLSAQRKHRSQTLDDESEEDSDKVLSSSNEDFRSRFMVGEGHDESPLGRSASAGSEADSLQDDEDETGTALGIVNDSAVFTPQPNVFSHPPSGRLMQVDEDSYFPPLPSSRNSTSRPTDSTSSAPSNIQRPTQSRTRSHTPYNMIAPGSTVDHDAALRASLSTLLSCAAAARGLQKRETTVTTGPSRSVAPPRIRGANQTQPNILRIVPESALAQIEEQSKESRSSDPPSSPISLPSKRKSKSPIRDRRKRNRQVHNLHSEDIMQVSPTLTTWVVGAGVLVLFSAISFTAGYTLGKEVGRVDAAIGNTGGRDALSCGSEVSAGSLGRGLARRSGWRWGNSSGVSV